MGLGSTLVRNYQAGYVGSSAPRRDALDAYVEMMRQRQIRQQTLAALAQREAAQRLNVQRFDQLYPAPAANVTDVLPEGEMGPPMQVPNPDAERHLNLREALSGADPEDQRAILAPFEQAERAGRVERFKRQMIEEERAKKLRTIKQAWDDGTWRHSPTVLAYMDDEGLTAVPDGKGGFTLGQRGRAGGAIMGEADLSSLEGLDLTDMERAVSESRLRHGLSLPSQILTRRNQAERDDRAGTRRQGEREQLWARQDALRKATAAVRAKRVEYQNVLGMAQTAQREYEQAMGRAKGRADQIDPQLNQARLRLRGRAGALAEELAELEEAVGAAMDEQPGVGEQPPEGIMGPPASLMNEPEHGEDPGMGASGGDLRELIGRLIDAGKSDEEIEAILSRLGAQP